MISYAQYNPVGVLHTSPLQNLCWAKGVLNIKNEKDSYCFAFSILASIHSVGYNDHPYSPAKYKPYMRELNLKGLKFPLKPKDVKMFERQISTISVNILQWTENQALPLQVTEYRD